MNNKSNNKNFEQLSPAAQSAIKSFRETFWKKFVAYYKPDKYDLLAGLVISFLVFNNCSEEEIPFAHEFIISKNYFIPKFVKECFKPLSQVTTNYTNHTFNKNRDSIPMSSVFVTKPSNNSQQITFTSICPNKMCKEHK